LNEPFEYSIVFDTTTNLNVAEDRSTESSEDKVLLFEDTTTNWNVKKDWSTKNKGMSKSDRCCREWSIEHGEGNLRSTISIWHCHLIDWDFTSLISIHHCHESIDTLLTNVWHCRKLFVEDLVFDGSWILIGCFASCSCSLHVTWSDLLSWQKPTSWVEALFPTRSDFLSWQEPTSWVEALFPTRSGFYCSRAHEIEHFCTLSQLHVELSSLRVPNMPLLGSLAWLVILSEVWLSCSKLSEVRLSHSKLSELRVSLECNAARLGSAIHLAEDDHFSMHSDIKIIVVFMPLLTAYRYGFFLLFFSCRFVVCRFCTSRRCFGYSAMKNQFHFLYPKINPFWWIYF
jgi:hypothetical protein